MNAARTLKMENEIFILFSIIFGSAQV